MSELIVLDKDEIINVVKLALDIHEKEKGNSKFPKLYSVNQVSKQLHMAFATVKKHIQMGLLKTTKSGLITEEALKEYLQG